MAGGWVKLSQEELMLSRLRQDNQEERRLDGDVEGARLLIGSLVQLLARLACLAHCKPGISGRVASVYR
jgi:hypothetical protein